MNEHIPPARTFEPADIESPDTPQNDGDSMPEERPGLAHDANEMVESPEDTSEVGSATGPSQAELARRADTAETAGAMLEGIISPSGGFFEAKDPFSLAMTEALRRGAQRVQEGLRNPDPKKRSKAVNFMKEVNGDIAHRMLAAEGEPAPEATPEQKLNDYAFAPSEMKSLVEELQEDPQVESGEADQSERPLTAEDNETSEGETEQLTPQEKMVAREVARYTTAVAEKAEEEGLLVRGDHVFGPVTEAAFGDYFSTVQDGGFGDYPEEARRKIAADAFVKFRDRACRRLGIEKKKSSNTRSRQSEYKLTA